MAKKPTIRILLPLTAQYNWPLHQMDVKNVFLQGQLKETIYMSQPVGFVDKTCPHHVRLLHKSLYGLKQAPGAWYDRFAPYLLSLGFAMSTL